MTHQPLRTAIFLVLCIAASVIAITDASPTAAPVAIDDTIDEGYVVITQALEEVLELETGKDATDVEGITDAVNLIVLAYNERIEELNDPLKRRLNSAAVERIDEVTFSQRKRNLRSSDGRNLRSKKYVRVTFSVVGTCYKCKKNDKLVNYRNGRRLLSTSTIPTISEIMTKQNQLIIDLENDTVREVSELRAKAVKLAAEANVAAANAKVRELFVMDLEEETKKQKNKLSAARAVVLQLYNQSNPQLLYIQKLLQSFNQRITNKLVSIDAKLTTAKHEFTALSLKAANLRSQATAAELLALEAEEQAVEEVQTDAKNQNTINAKEVTSTTTDVNFIDANFYNSVEGFAYHDNMFYGTNWGDYASGHHVTDNGGSLTVDLGGVDDRHIFGMSGGWARTFTLKSDATNVQIFFKYKLEMSLNFETDESAYLLASFDDTLLETTSGTGFVVSLKGKVDRTTSPSTGVAAFGQNLGSVSSGTHTIKLGAFLNKKTYRDEHVTATFSSIMVMVDYSTTAMVVDVNLDGSSDEPPSDTTELADTDFDNVSDESSSQNGVLAADNFDSDSDGFSFEAGAFGDNKPQYVNGWHNADGTISVKVGGHDDHHVSSMSGGWVKDFHVSKSGLYELVVRFKMILSHTVESGEDGHALVKIDGHQSTIGFIEGAKVLNTSPDWQTFTIQGNLDKGTHQFAIGGMLTKKTYHDEEFTVIFDYVRATPK